MRKQWPWHADTREDRAKRIALSYRRLALALAAGEADASALADLDAQWADLGAGWVRPIEQELDLDGWLSAGELAALLCIDPQRFRDWARRGHIRSAVFDGPHRLYCVGDVVAYERNRRLKRIAVLS